MHKKHRVKDGLIIMLAIVLSVSSSMPAFAQTKEVFNQEKHSKIEQIQDSGEKNIDVFSSLKEDIFVTIPSKVEDSLVVVKDFFVDALTEEDISVDPGAVPDFDDIEVPEDLFIHQVIPKEEDDFISINPDKEEIPEERFQVMDAFTDVAYLGNGRSMYRFFTAPRLVYETSEGVAVRPDDWHLFSEQSETQLHAGEQGYRYTVPFSHHQMIEVAAGLMYLGKKEYIPEEGTFIQTETEDAVLTEYQDVYPHIDVTFTDRGAWRQRSLVLKEVPKDLALDDKMIFWEEYRIPEGFVVTDGEQTIKERQIMDNRFVSLQSPTGEQLMISGAIVFDSSVNEINDLEFSKSREDLSQIVEVDYDKGFVRIGIMLDASYVLAEERMYPITIDPWYYFCTNLENNIGGCSITDFYMRTDGGAMQNPRATVNDFLYMGRGGSITRHIPIIFNNNFSNDLTDATINNARLRLYLHERSSGSAGSIRSKAKRITYHNPPIWPPTTVNNILNDSQYTHFRNNIVSSDNSNVIEQGDNWRIFPVTQAVRAWQSGFHHNLGLLIEPDDNWPNGNNPPAGWEDAIFKFSSSRGIGRPYLSVDLTHQRDLRTDSRSINRQVFQPGETIELDLRVRNSSQWDMDGIGQVGYYFRSNVDYNINHIHHTDLYQPLGGDRAVDLTHEYTIPANTAPGTYYFYYAIDPADAVDETNENNNRFSYEITVEAAEPVGEPNLRLERETVDDTTLDPGQEVDLDVRVYNRGNANSNHSDVGYYFSTNDRFDANDTYLGEDFVSALNSGQYSSEGITVSIPNNVNRGQQYYILFVADYNDDIDESNENDNVVSVRITINNLVGEPNLRPENQRVNDTTVYPGQEILASTDVVNRGNAQAAASDLAYYFSANNVLDNNDQRLNTDAVGVLNPGGSNGESASITIPNDLPDAFYYILFEADYNEEVAESDENDNVASVRLTLTQPQDNFEVNDTAQQATNLNEFFAYENNALTLHTNDEDWFRFMHANQVYYLKVRGFANNSVGPYTLRLAIDNNQLMAETIERNGSVDTYLELYNADLVRIGHDDDGGVGFFSRLVYQFPALGYCNGLCEGGIVVASSDLPDADGDGVADVEEAFAGTDIFGIDNDPLFNQDYRSVASTQHDFLDGSANNYGADPVNLRNGSFEFNIRDYSLNARGVDIDFIRTYNSKTAEHDSMFGKGWTASYHQFAYQDPDTGSIRLHLSGTRSTLFTSDDNGQTFIPAKGEREKLFWEDGTLVYRMNDGTRYEFERFTSQLSILHAIRDTHGNAITFEYITRKDVPLLRFIRDASGRRLSLTYGHVDSETEWNKVVEFVEDFSNSPRIVGYLYDEQGRLTQVNTQRAYGAEVDVRIDRYRYNDQDQLIQHIDPRGTILVNEYDGTGRVLRQYEHNPRIDAEGDSRLLYEMSYEDNGHESVPDAVFCRVLTSHRGSFEEEDFDSLQERHCFNDDELKIAYSDGEEHTERWIYNDQGLMTRYADANGSETSYTYDQHRRLVETVFPLTDNWQTVEQLAYENQFDQIIDRRHIATHRETDEVVEKRKQYIRDQETGAIIEEIDALGNTEAFRFDEYGNVDLYTDKRGNTTTYAYDDQGNYRTSELFVATQVNGERQEKSKYYAHDQRGNLTVLINERGHQTHYRYDNHDNLRQMINSLGHITDYTYDIENHKVSETNARGFVTRYVYDTDIAASLLSTIREGEEGEEIAVHTVYDWLGNLIRETDPNGNHTEYRYDAANRLVETRYPYYTDFFTYDAVANIIEEHNSLGQRIQYVYDSRNLLTETKRFLSAIDEEEEFLNSQRVYDGFGRLVQTIDGRGGVTEFIYDREDRILSKINALGEETRYRYDSAGNKTSELWTRAIVDESLRNRFGDSVSFIYDEANRLTKEVNAMNIETSYQYDAADNLVFVADRHAEDEEPTRVTSFTYDILHRLVAQTDALGQTKQFTYDEMDNLLSETDEMDRTTAYQYDAFDRRIRTIDPSEEETEVEYDFAGNRVGIIYPDQTTKAFVFDDMHRLEEKVNQLGDRERFIYDALGNQIAIQNTLGNTTTFVYDLLNRLVEEINATGTLTQYTYNENDERISQSVAGKETQFRYDALGRVTQITHPGDRQELFAYDPDGNLSVRIDGNQLVTQFRYDALNRLIEKGNEDDGITRFVYDQWDNILETETPAIRKVYAYDERNQRLREEHFFDGVHEEGERGATVLRTYMPDGQLRSQANAMGDVFLYGYDARGRLADVSFGGEALARYRYDAVGNPISLAYQNGVSTTYQYDDARRMIGFEVVNSDDEVLLTQAYTYDAAANRTALRQTGINQDPQNVAYHYDVLDQLRVVRYGEGEDLQAMQFDYDVWGNRTAMQHALADVQYAYTEGTNELARYVYNDRLAIDVTYDGNGSVLREQITRGGDSLRAVDYDWDAEGRLTAMRYEHLNMPAYLGDARTQEVVFRYDELGNRVEKRVNSEGALRTFFVNDGLRVLDEVSEGGDSRTAFIYGLDQVLRVDEHGGFTFVHTDVLGSTVMTTDWRGEVVEQYQYDPFGAMIGSLGRLWSTHLFTGQEFDLETELYYYNARYYNPRLGRFLSRDKYLGEEGVSVTRNGYVYVRNNPLKFVDPTGWEEESVWDEEPSLHPLYNLSGNVQEYVHQAAILFDVHPAIVAAVLSRENGNWSSWDHNEYTRIAKRMLNYVGNNYLGWDDFWDNGLGMSEGLGNIKPSHARNVLNHFYTHRPHHEGVGVLEWSADNLTSEFASVFLIGGGMRMSIDQRFGVGFVGALSLEQMAEMVARHNNPEAPHNWKSLDAWLTNYTEARAEHLFNDFTNDVSKSLEILEGHFSGDIKLRFF